MQFHAWNQAIGMNPRGFMHGSTIKNGQKLIVIAFHCSYFHFSLQLFFIEALLQLQIIDFRRPINVQIINLDSCSNLQLEFPSISSN